MTFIDRLETDLVGALESQIASKRSWPAPLRRFARRGRLRTLAALTAAAAIASPAIAIGVPPILHGFEGESISTSADAPPAEQLALLGILRDPSPRARVNPDTIGSSLLSELHGVRSDYIRRLPPAPGFSNQLLYSVSSGKYGPAKFDPSVSAYVPTEARNLLCVEQVDTTGVGGSCEPTSAITSGFWLESAGMDGYGIVPDGVATVILRYPDHPAQTEAVTENTFSYPGYPSPEGPITKGGGPEHPSPGPTPAPVASTTWLNADGDVISTHTR
jgi:hypothetical protein